MTQDRDDRPSILVISTGGTIASVRDDSSAAEPRLSARDLVAAVPQLAAVADIKTQPFRQLPSSDLGLADLIALGDEIERAVGSGVSGIVVTQGTDTLEETSFALDLLWGGTAPVILTGAMRHAALPGADGPANLLAAVQVAASPLARDCGALVVFNDEIHLPLHVRKTHTASTATFRSPLTGPIGWIVEDRPRIALRRPGRHHIRIASAPDEMPAVALAKIVLGDDVRLLQAIEPLGYRGLVVEATGGGHVPRALVGPLARLAQRMPVVLASRTGVGETLRATYGFPGSETNLLSYGLIPSGILDGPKSRMLLMLMLIAGASDEAIVAAFETVGVPGSRPPLHWPAA